MLWRLKTLRKNSQTPLQQHEAWSKKSKVGANDRAKHEHEALARVLELGICYDQFNVANSAAFERVNKRMMLIESAYRDGEVPNYDGSEFFMGDEVATDGSLVDPKMRRHVAEALKDEALISKERRKSAEERKLRTDARKPAK